MPNDGSLDILPLSPCTSGSLGLDHHFLGTVPLKVVENHSTSSLKESHVTQVEEKAVVVEVHKKGDEKEDGEKKEGEDHTDHIERERTKHVKVEDIKEVTHDVPDVVKDLTENARELKITTTTRPTPAAASTPVEKMATGVPEGPIKSGMPSCAATRGLSAASLALKKKQAAEIALAATKAMAAEVPETESISDRIKMFGGSNPGRVGAPGARRIGVRDMVQKFKKVEDLSQEEIAHVAKGHDARGVCSAYSLSTASRPTNMLRSAPRRKMSHELNEQETRGIVKATVSGGYSRASEEHRVGVSQESVQSVRNAKSLFENLARSEGAQQ
ncbi:hypothetical protein BGZ82_006268 [Podila clonocystis]|nr:hypothetical protein BGZ82_006268 [Podila clonocystis]